MISEVGTVKPVPCIVIIPFFTGLNDEGDIDDMLAATDGVVYVNAIVFVCELYEYDSVVVPNVGHPATIIFVAVLLI